MSDSGGTNIGETLAYWYLRLNGFMPMSNFVLHHYNAIRNNADADVLAVRFPHVFEEVGGQMDDWDKASFDSWGISLDETIVVICEVKFRRCTRDERDRNFTFDRLLYAVRRIGVLPESLAKDISERLVTSRVERTNGIAFVKVFMSGREQTRGSRANETRQDSCCFLSAKHATRFIYKRMCKHRGPKGEAWTFFPNELIQFLAWHAKEPFLFEKPEG